MKRHLKLLGVLICISLLVPNQPIAATSVECSPVTTVVGNLTRLTFATAGTCNWTVPANVRYMKFLIVAGGGGGGGATFGGGGGGGVVITSPGAKITPGNQIQIKVGAGGNGGLKYDRDLSEFDENYHGQSGGDSSIGTFLARGGGGGAGFVDPLIYSDRALAGGNPGGNQGGGSASSSAVGRANFQRIFQASASSMTQNNNISVYGNHIAGAASSNNSGAGGGGAGEHGKWATVSNVPGKGGSGVASSITGTELFYGGGGTGGFTSCANPCTQALGGVGGGGNGGSTANGGAGEVNSGGGGGGAGRVIEDNFNPWGSSGGAGGSGLVVITYEHKICIEDGACTVGDIGPGGGRIFHIETSTNTAFEAAPNFWPRSCAAGGLCNLGDTGFGGGTIFSITSGTYREISQNSLEFFGRYDTHIAANINSSSPYPINGNIYGRWNDASRADYFALAEGRKNYFLFSTPLQFQNSDYWTTDATPPNEINFIGQHLFTILLGSSPSQSWGSDEEYHVRFFASYTPGDTTDAFANDNEWANHQTSTSIGSGAANTALLKSATSVSAAQIAADLTLNEKSDWYLPSIGELQALFNVRNTIEGLGNRKRNYWSSSSHTAAAANAISLDNPNTSFRALKYDEGAIRPIRSFSIAAAALPGVVLTMNSGLRTATFRTVNTISAVATEAGKVTFFADGKKIAGCISVQTNANTASCGWKPSVRKSQQLTARLKTSGGQYSTILILEVAVVSRTTRR